MAAPPQAFVVAETAVMITATSKVGGGTAGVAVKGAVALFVKAASLRRAGCQQLALAAPPGCQSNNG